MKQVFHPRITLHNLQKDLPISLSLMKKVIGFLLESLKISTREVIFHFVTERKICKLHETFFNDPSPTDCITFPLDPPGESGTLGEAFVCPKTALTYAKKHQIDPREELHRYVIHCLLHMIGYSDTTPAARIKMKKKEKSCLNSLIKSFETNLSITKMKL